MDGRKLSHQTLEDMRKLAVERVKDGVSPSRLADALGFSVRTIYHWLAMDRDGGEVALDAKPIPGRPPKVSEDHFDALFSIVRDRSPYDFGLDSSLWTVRLIGIVLKQELGITLARSNLTMLLHRLGLAPRKPLYQAQEQDPRAVRRWKEREYPALRARVRKERATLYFLDESGIRTTDSGGRTWGEKGRRPVVSRTGRNLGVNMIGALSPQGALRFMVLPGTFHTAAFLEFLDRLAKGSPQKVFLVLDRHPVHKSRAVEQKVKELQGKLELVFLPEYAPQVNPEEGVWSLVKPEVRRKDVDTLGELKEAVRETLRSLAKMPGYLRHIFHNPQFAYVFNTT
jgi:transposase